ncbi:MAG: DUF481 domain-containing protein [Myxococcales bacterium]|nr:DUF481 domain-containing protein [Myxococcales bacterium]MDD9968461.1 DUF481 domain-containing protein [Myxococcales bacterium]
MSAALLAAASCWVSDGLASAQVNTETLRLGQPEQGVHGSVKGDVSLRRGNVELFELGGDAKLFYQTGYHTPLVAVRAELGKQGGERFAENAFVHARWTAMWLERLGTEVFGQVQYDSFVRLKFRTLIGAGPRAAVVVLDWLECFVGTGYMLEREVLKIPATDSHPQTTLNHRSTTYAAIKVRLSPVLKLNNVTYLQPRFDHLRDVRVLEELELELAATEQIQVVNTFSMRLDSDPPDQVRKLDLGLTVGFRVGI